MEGYVVRLTTQSTTTPINLDQACILMLGKGFLWTDGAGALVGGRIMDLIPILSGRLLFWEAGHFD